MTNLRLFWTWIYIVGLGGFAVIAMAMIPLGFRDLIRLLRELGQPKEKPESPDQSR